MGLLRDSAADVIEKIILQRKARPLEGRDEFLMGQMRVVVEKSFLAIYGNADNRRHMFVAHDVAQLGRRLVGLLKALRRNERCRRACR